MPDAYIYGKSRKTDKSFKRYRLLKILIKLVLIAAVIVGIYVAYDIRRGKAAEVPVVSKSYELTQASSNQTFTTDFYTFDADNDWKYMESESTKTQYIYRRLRGELIEHELTVYVNDSRTLPETTRVLPVEIAGDNRFTPSPVSEHCKSTYPKTGGNRNPKIVDFAGSKLNCNPDSIGYSLVVGKLGGDGSLQMKRDDGSTATYSIIYRDLSFGNSGISLDKIINSFQAK